MFTSWRTTALGVCTILAALGAAGKALLDGDPNTGVDMPVLIAAITAGLGLIMARDHKVSSEQAGVAAPLTVTVK